VRYTDESKERVRDAVDMIELVGAKTELRRAGANRYSGLCPFHEERTPSFGIDPVKKVYHCFGCGAGGDVFKFVQETEGVDFSSALEVLADRAGVPLEAEHEDPQAAARRQRRERLYAVLERAARFYERYLWESDESAGAREYLAGRGLGEEVLRTFRVGYAPSGYDKLLLASKRAGFSARELYDAGLVQRSRGDGRVYDRFRSRIMFPLCDARGRVLGFGARLVTPRDRAPKYLNSPEGDLYHKGRQLFAHDLARPGAGKAGEVIVAEGYTDVLALHQAGLTNAVGIMGTALTPEQANALGVMVGGDGRILLALDADEAGQEAMLRAATLSRRPLHVVPLPEGKDPAEIDPAELRPLIQRAVPLPEFRVGRLLASADLGTTEGRERVLESLRPVLGAVMPGPARDELVRRAASAIGLSEQLVGDLARTPAAAAPSQPVKPPEARMVIERRERTERSFLALCIALPHEGREALRKVSLDDHFTSTLTRKAAQHLCTHLAAPLANLPDDEELATLMAELTVRAGRDPADADVLELELLQLEKDRLERKIAAGGQVGELATQRREIKERLDAAMARASGTD
jgi:DNA primase